MKFFTVLILFHWVFLTLGCISVNIGESKVEKSDAIKFEPPTTPFESVATDLADHTWQNKSNGNSISLFSECKRDTDPQISTIEKDSLAGVEAIETKNREWKNYNQRNSLFSHIRGKLDGVDIELRLVILKKNNCIYSLSYVGSPAWFAENQDSFDKFVGGFSVP